MLIDTDVVIWYMRGNPHAAELLDNRESIVLSTVTYMELIQGGYYPLKSGYFGLLGLVVSGLEGFFIFQYVAMHMNL